MKKYETVVGLEVHVQLSTKTKAFCGCRTKFGAQPNTEVCPVCLGQPGVLPVFNKEAFISAIKVAIALGCDIQKTIKFDRKNYYYPDLPKNYQISQFDMPMAYKGKVDVTLEGGSVKSVGITRVHIEEDAGKLIHDTAAGASYVDLNRTGTPLLEIVTEPDIRSPLEAHTFLTDLKRIIKYLGVSDCNMEEGSLRCDANISLRKAGEKKLGVKVEIKNMNSFKAVKDALTYEEGRQADLLDEGGAIFQETRLWDEKNGVTSPMRSKEESQDYRYFPEPDLVPFEVSKELVEEVRGKLPELPAAKKERFLGKYGLSEKDTDVLVSERDVADYFEEVASSAGAESASNWIRGEVMMHMKERYTDIKGLGLSAGHLAKLIKMTQEGSVSNLAAKEVLRECIETHRDPSEIVKEKDLGQVSDASSLAAAIDKVIAENAKSVNDFKSGKENAISFLVGQVMKETKGKANPKVVNDLLRKKLSS